MTRLALISDTHLAARAREFGANWEIILRWIRHENPDMVIHLGDISADGAGQPRDLDTAAAALAEIDVPVCAIPGNHDIGDNPGMPARLGEMVHGEPEIAASRIDAYRQRFGADFWTISLPHWQLVGLDAQLFGSGLDAEQAQWEWLGKVLDEGSGRLGVMIHKPLYRYGSAETDRHGRYVPPVARHRLLTLLRRRDLAFVASGHTHQTRRHLADGIEHVWVPSTAFVIPDSLQETIGAKMVGAMLLDLDRNRHTFRLVVPEGLVAHNLLDQVHVYPQIAALVKGDGTE